MQKLYIIEAQNKLNFLQNTQFKSNCIDLINEENKNFYIIITYFFIE